MNEESVNKIQKSAIHLPYYAKEGCQVLSKDWQLFTTRGGHQGKKLVVTFLDAKRKTKEAIAQIIWFD